MDRIPILRINNHIVLNFVDLQEWFSPWEVYEQRESFVSFAQIHCCLLTTWVKGENGTVDAARYLDKVFWLELLKQYAGIRDSVTFPDALSVIRRQLEQLLGGEIQKEEAQKRIFLEMEAMCIEEKLAYIQTSARLTDSELVIAAEHLALCELTEIDARKRDFSRWTPSQKTMRQDMCPVSFETEERPEEHTDAQLEPGDILNFPAVDKLVLKTRREAYRYWYHESDTLESGTIKTVRVEASAQRGQELRIELYRADGSLAQTVDMVAGEYRDLNTAGDKVVCVLPTLSISDTLCIARKDYASTEITIIPKNAPEWSLNVDSSTARKISSFAAGDNTKDGFLYLRSGKLMKGFYKPNENYSIRQQLEMVEDRLVEVRIADGYYELLTEYGEIISNNPNRAGIKSCVSLYSRDTEQNPLFRETACSDSGMSTAVHEKENDLCTVRFG